MGRNNGLCELCGSSKAHHAHHRKPRGMGGVKGDGHRDVNRPSNGLALCPPCHGWVEGNREEATMKGLLCPRNVDPSGFPALLNTWLGRDHWITLNDDGTYTDEGVDQNSCLF